MGNTANTNTTISSTSATETGLQQAITPSATSSKIIVLFSGHYSQNPNGGAHGPQVVVSLYRDNTHVKDFSYDYAAVTTVYNSHGFSISYLDTPSTTSAVTYKIRARLLYASHQMRFNPSNYASWTVMEVAG